MTRSIRWSLLAVLLPTAAAAVPPATQGTLPAFTPNIHDFGSVEVGDSSAAQVFTLNNPTADPLTVTLAALGGAEPDQYSIGANTCAGVIPALGSCTISVTFTPTAAGNQVALLRFAYTAPPPNPPAGSETNATLFGNGTVPPPAAPPAPVPMLGDLALAIGALLMLLGALMTRRRPLR